MKKIKIVGLGIFFSLFIVACSSPSSSPSPSPTSSKESQGQLNANPSSISFTYGQTSFQTSQVSSAQNGGTGAYTASSSNTKIAKVDINSVGLVQIIPVGVGDVVITVEKAGDNTFDATSVTIPVTITKAEQNLAAGVPEGRYFISKDTTSAIRIASNVFGGVKGDQDLSNLKDDDKNKGTYSITDIATTDTSTGDVLTAKIDEKTGEFIITAIATGDATITIIRTGDDNYKDSTVSVYVTVNDKATQDSLSFEYGGNPVTTDIIVGNYDLILITAAALQSQEHSVKSSNPLVATAINDSGLFAITPLRAGVVIITLTRAGEDPATTNPVSKSILVTINKPTDATFGSVSSGFTAIYNKEVDTASTVLTNSSSTGDFFPTSLRPDVATASTNANSKLVITFEKVGTTDITLIRASDYKYLESELKPKVRVTVDQAPQTLATGLVDNTITIVYVKGDDFATVDITGGKGDGKFGFSNEIDVGVISTSTDIAAGKISLEGVLTITFGNAGTATLDIIKDSDRNYTAGRVRVTVTVNKATQELAVANEETTITVARGSSPEDIEITGGKGVGEYVVTSDIASVASADIDDKGKLTITFAKTISGTSASAIITIFKKAGRNYQESNAVTVTVVVNEKQNQIIKISKTNFLATYKYGGSTEDIIIFTTTANGTKITGASGKWSVTSDNPNIATGAVTLAGATNDYLLTVSFKQVGETTLYIRRAADATYNPSRPQAITVEVTRAEQTISATPSDFELVFSETDTTTSTVTTNVKNSTGAYQLTVSDADVIGAVFANNTLVTNSDPATVTITTLKSGESNIKIYKKRDSNYKQSNSVTITTQVNTASQDAIIVNTASFVLLTGGTTTATIERIGGSAMDIGDGGEFSAISDQSFVTTTIDADGTLHIKALGAGDALITILKLGNNKYKPSNSVEISIQINKADQILTSSINQHSFAKAGLSVTANIGGGEGAGDYVVTSQNNDIATVGINRSLLTIRSVASGDTIVTIKKLGDNDYNDSATLDIAIRVKTQQTLSLSPDTLSALIFGADATTQVSGGEGTGDYVVTVNPSIANTIVVTATVDASDELQITPIGAGDAIISVYKKGDERYNQSNTATIAVSVLRVDSNLPYVSVLPIPYSPNAIPQSIGFVGVTPEGGVFTLEIDATHGSLVTGDALASINEVSGVITYTPGEVGGITFSITRAATNKYAKVITDVKVIIERAPRDFVVGPFSGEFIVGIDVEAQVSSSGDGDFSITSSKETTFATADINPTTGLLTVTPLNIGNTSFTIERVSPRNYETASGDVPVEVRESRPLLASDIGAISDDLVFRGTATTIILTNLIDGAQYSIENPNGTPENIATAVIDTITKVITITPQTTTSATIGQTAFKLVRDRTAQYAADSIDVNVEVFKSPVQISKGRTVGNLVFRGAPVTIQLSPSTTGYTKGTVVGIDTNNVTITDEGLVTITPDMAVTAPPRQDIILTINRAGSPHYADTAVSLTFSVGKATLSSTELSFVDGLRNVGSGNSIEVTATASVPGGTYAIDNMEDRASGIALVDSTTATATGVEIKVIIDTVLNTPTQVRPATYILTRKEDNNYKDATATVNLVILPRLTTGKLTFDDPLPADNTIRLVFNGEFVTIISSSSDGGFVVDIPSPDNAFIGVKIDVENGKNILTVTTKKVTTAPVRFTLSSAAGGLYDEISKRINVVVTPANFDGAFVSIGGDNAATDVSLSYTQTTDIVIISNPPATIAAEVVDSNDDPVGDLLDFDINQATNTITVIPLGFTTNNQHRIKITLSADNYYNPPIYIPVEINLVVESIAEKNDVDVVAIATITTDDNTGYIFTAGGNTVNSYKLTFNAAGVPIIDSSVALSGIVSKITSANAKDVIALKEGNNVRVFVTDTDKVVVATGDISSNGILSFDNTATETTVASVKNGAFLKGASSNVDAFVFNTPAGITAANYENNALGITGIQTVQGGVNSITTLPGLPGIVYYASNTELGAYNVTNYKSGSGVVAPDFANSAYRTLSVVVKNIIAAQSEGVNYVFAVGNRKVYAYNSDYFATGRTETGIIEDVSADEFNSVNPDIITTTLSGVGTSEVFLVFASSPTDGKVTILDFKDTFSSINTIALTEASAVSTLQVGGRTFLVVVGKANEIKGISIFELK